MRKFTFNFFGYNSQGNFEGTGTLSLIDSCKPKAGADAIRSLFGSGSLEFGMYDDTGKVYFLGKEVGTYELTPADHYDSVSVWKVEKA